MERPRRSTVKRNALASTTVELNGRKRKAVEKKLPDKKIEIKKDENDSESSSDEFVRVKSDPGPLKLKEEPKVEPDFGAIENSIFDGVTRLSESESDSDFEEVDAGPPLLPVAADKVKIEIAQADSVSDSKLTPRTKLQLSKLRKAVTNGLMPKLEKETSNEAAPVIEEKGDKKRGKSIQNTQQNDSIPAKTTRRSKNVLATVKKDVVKDEDSDDKDKKVKAAPKSKGNRSSKDDKTPAKSESEISKKNTPDLKTKPSAANEKSAKGKKPTDKTDQKSKPKQTPKSKDRKEVPSTSTKMEPGSSANAIPKDIDDMDMNELLALGENLGLKPISQTGQSSGSEHSDEGDDWEEVQAEETEEKKHVIPKEGVQITLEMPDLMRRRRKKKEDLQAEMNRHLNRVRREFQILFHKTSVLCWLAHGFYLNNLLNNEDLLGIALSIIPSSHCLPCEQIDLKYMKQILDWFVKLIDYSEGFTHIDDDYDLPVKIESLQKQFSRRVAKSKRELALMFVIILRAIGINARLVVSLQPMPLKPQSSDLIQIKPQKEKNGKKEEKEKSPEKKQPEEKTVKSNKEEKPSTSKQSETSRKTATKRKAEEPIKNPSPRKTRSGAVRKIYKEENLDSESDEDKPLNSRGSIKSKSKEDEPLLSPKKKGLSEEEKEKLKKASEKRNPRVRRSVSVKKKDDDEFDPKVCEPDSEEGDSDFTPESRKKLKRVSPKEVKESTPKPRASTGPKRKGLKVLSSSEDEKHRSKLKKKMGCDYWIEVYVHKEESWIPVDVTRGKLNCAEEIRAIATQPIIYVIAWNRDNTVKDVTRRYVSQYSQVTAKQRADEKWWNKTLKPFKPKSTAIDKEEEGQLHMAQLNRPMPKSVAECKNHPLYALKRHLLKFEAIYPPDSPTLGFVKGEALYARQNVYNLHSREIWIKEAKVVRLGEKPYKIVKARPKYDRMSGNVITDLPLELFGPWQVQDYEPPAAVDGKVPRNSYGNVELFKPTMLPKGCVHLQLPSLNRIAKKLQIDCAPAVVGFDYHCGGSHPTYDGFVVCEEYVDVLMDAWNKEIDESAKRQKERNEKRIYGNWRKLIRGLIIREHLSLRYDFKEDDPDNEPANNVRNEIAAAEARLSQTTAPIHSVFPKLMAKVRQSGNSWKTGGTSSSTAKKRLPAGSKPKKAGVSRRKKKESSEEEEEEESDESTTSEEDVNMVLLSDEDSGSEFDHNDDENEEEDE